MGMCVAHQSSQKYAGQNSIFAEYCFDHDEYRDLLEPWFVEKLEELDTHELFLKEGEEFIFAQCFLALEWNLLCHSR